MATPGTPLLTVMDVSRVVARVNIPQAQAASVKLGDPATLTQVESGQEVPGKVIVVSPATDPASTTVQVWIEAGNPGAKLKPGASVHAEIVTETIRNAMVVPVAAILPGEEGGTSVLTVAPIRACTAARSSWACAKGDKVQILSGVRPGEEVVISGGVGVDDKAKVKVLSQPERRRGTGRHRRTKEMQAESQMSDLSIHPQGRARRAARRTGPPATASPSFS